VPPIFIETRKGEERAWVHTEDPGIKHSYRIEVSKELRDSLVEAPLESDDPFNELIQVAVELGYRLGG
jgi:hypothetical protein